MCGESDRLAQQRSMPFQDIDVVSEVVETALSLASLAKGTDSGSKKLMVIAFYYKLIALL